MPDSQRKRDTQDEVTREEFHFRCIDRRGWHDVTTFTEPAPYSDCFNAGQTLQALKGLHISDGWSREIRSRLGGAQSCTNLMEILIPMGTTAFQSLTTVRLNRPAVVDANGKPGKVDSC